MTLKELSEHPELASEEERKALEECMRAFREFGKRMGPTLNGVTLESGRSREEIARGYYVETMLVAAILESFAMAPEQELKDISKFVFNYTDKAFIWDVPVTEFFKCLSKSCAIGLLDVTKEDKYNPSFAITDDGYIALRQQTYANLAQSALFNMKTQQLNDKAVELSEQTVKLNEQMVELNKKMLVVAIASAVAAVVGVCVAVFGVTLGLC